jgi:hypothetical protein
MMVTFGPLKERWKLLCLPALAALGWALIMPKMPPQALEAAQAKEAERSGDGRQVTLLFTVNNLGYTDVCG